MAGSWPCSSSRFPLPRIGRESAFGVQRAWPFRAALRARGRFHLACRLIQGNMRHTFNIGLSVDLYCSDTFRHVVQRTLHGSTPRTAGVAGVNLDFRSARNFLTSTQRSPPLPSHDSKKDPENSTLRIGVFRADCVSETVKRLCLRTTGRHPWTRSTRPRLNGPRS